MIGVDFHIRFQQIAMLNTETGEVAERRPTNSNAYSIPIFRARIGRRRVPGTFGAPGFSEVYKELRPAAYNHAVCSRRHPLGNFPSDDHRHSQIELRKRDVGTPHRSGRNGRDAKNTRDSRSGIGAATLLVLLAGAAGARIVAADLGAAANDLLNGLAVSRAGHAGLLEFPALPALGSLFEVVY